MKKYAIIGTIIFLLCSLEVVMAFEFTPGVSLSLSQGYNDNVFFTKTNREGSFVTLVSPGVSFALRSPDSQLRIAYTPSTSFYESHSELNETSHHLTGDESLSMSEKLDLTVKDEFVKSREINNLISVPILGPLKSSELELTQNNAGGSILYKIRDDLSCTFGGSYIVSELKGSTGSGNINSDVYGGNILLAYMLNTRSTVSVKAEYEKNHYRSDSNSTYEYYTSGLGITHKFTPTLTFDITGAAVIADFHIIRNHQTTYFSGTARLSKKFEKGDAVLFFAQTFEPGIEYSQSLRTQTASLLVSRPLSDRWKATGQASYSTFKSVSDVSATSIVPAKGEEERIGGDVSYKIRPWAAVGLSYNFVNHVDKIDRTRDYYNNIAFLTFTVSWEKPRAD